MSFPIVGPFSLHYFGSGKGNIRDKIPLNEWWRKKSVVEQEYLSGSLLFGTNARKRQNNACQLQTRPKIIHNFYETCILDIFQMCVVVSNAILRLFIILRKKSRIRLINFVHQ